jgi:hypothetical protein
MPSLEIGDSLVVRVARRLATYRTYTEQPGTELGTEDSPLARAMAGKSAERLLREQPEALAFVLAGTAHLDPETRAVGVFLGDIVFESFRLAGRSTRPVRTTDFVSALRKNRQMALHVGRAHDRFAERYLRCSNTLKQPALIRYVTGVLLEPDETCAHTIPRDELGPLFIVIKSMIDVLDDDARAALEGDNAASSVRPS